MFTGAEIVVIDLAWDAEENGGSFTKVVTGFNDTAKYKWRCYGCGGHYSATVKEFMWKMERLKTPMLNGYCSSCSLRLTPRFDFESIFSFMEEGFKSYVAEVVEGFKQAGNKTTIFITKCKDCGSFCYSTLNTFEARGSFICGKCYARANRVKKNGSISDTMPEIIPWYSPKNPLPPEKVPMDRLQATGNNYILTCPRCKKEHTKRLDAIVRGGAYCEQCNHIFSSIKKNGSLRSEFPEVADLWDKAPENSISSEEVSPFSDMKGYFYCSGELKGLPEHTFYNTISTVVQAHKEGKLGCQVCAGFEIQEGINDLSSRFPEVAAMWDYEKNDLPPTKVRYNDRSRHHFICYKGHKFDQEVERMTSRSLGTYSHGCPICHGKKVQEGVNDLFTVMPSMRKHWDYDLNPELDPLKLSANSNKVAKFHCSNPRCHNIYETKIFNRVHGRVLFCEDCRARTFSQAEKDLCSVIRSWGITVEEEVTIPGSHFSIDIFLPEYNVAIEYNGIYWHSTEIRPDPNYHLNKYRLCEDQGINLFFIWEDSYLSDKSYHLDMLHALLFEDEIEVGDYELVSIPFTLGVKFRLQGEYTDLVGAIKTDTNSLIGVAGFKENILVTFDYIERPKDFLKRVLSFKNAKFLKVENGGLHFPIKDPFEIVREEEPTYMYECMNTRVDFPVNSSTNKVYNAGYSVYKLSDEQ